MSKNTAILWFGCDYLRFTIGGNEKSGIIERLFDGLSANSNEKFNQIFLGMPGFRFTTIDFGDKKTGLLYFAETNVIQFDKMLSSGGVKNCSYRVQFMSSIFHMPELRAVLIRAVTIWGTNEKAKITRCDIAADLNVTVKALRQKHSTFFRSDQTIGTRKEIQTFYLGSKRNNKKHFIRVYDKKLDSRKKGKFHIFGHYLTMKNPVSRVEVQMNVQTCDAMRITASDILALLENKTDEIKQLRLWAIFAQLTANPDGTCFDHILALARGIPRVEKIVRMKKALQNLDVVPYAKVMLGYARNLKTLGFDPVSWLQTELEKQEDQE